MFVCDCVCERGGACVWAYARALVRLCVSSSDFMCVYVCVCVCECVSAFVRVCHFISVCVRTCVDVEDILRMTCCHKNWKVCLDVFFLPSLLSQSHVHANTRKNRAGTRDYT